MSLPVRRVVISDSQWKRLQEDVWSDNFVKATLITGSGRREAIRIRYRGNHTRKYNKKSYEIAQGYKTLHLNSEYDDPSMIRNALSFTFLRWIGLSCPAVRHIRLELNGQDLGVYLEIEGVNRRFFNRRGIPFSLLVYAVSDDANFGLNGYDSSRRKSSLFNGYEHIIGTTTERKRLVEFIRNINTLRGQQLVKYLAARLDVDNYLRWLAGAVFTSNYDGFEQNYALYKHKTKLKYRMLPWDYEGTWGRNCYGRKTASDMVKATGYNELTRILLSIKPFREKYKQILQETLQSAFTASKIMPEVYRMHQAIAPYIREDKMRNWSYSVFEDEPDVIETYIKERRSFLKQALQSM